MANNVPAYENSVPKNFMEKMGFGCYPPGYDRKVHGPYHPGRYYGPKDTPLAEVRIRELADWIGRREKNPRSLFNLLARAHVRWAEKFEVPRKATSAPIVQFLVITSTLSYIALWKTLKHHKSHKYHW